MTHPTPQGLPCWSDFGADDIPALARFFTGLFGWSAEEMPGGGGYTILRHDGAAVAGIGPKQGPDSPALVSVSLATTDADAAARRAVDAGAHLDAGPMTVAGVGHFAILGLPGGQHCVAWQELGQRGFEARGVPGTPAFFEVVTPEPKSTEDILAAAFGYTFVDGPQGARMALCGDRPAFMVFPVRGHLVPGWAVHYEVADIEDARARALALGGTEIPGESGAENGMRYAGMTGPGGEPFWLVQND